MALSNGKYTIFTVNGVAEECSIGEILVKLSDVDNILLREILRENPYNANKIDSKHKSVVDALMWLKERLCICCGNILGSFITVAFTNAVLQFRTDPKGYIRSLEQIQSDEIKTFVLENSGFSDYGATTVGHLLLSALSDVGFSLGLTHHTLSLLMDSNNDSSADSIDSLIKFFSLEMLEFQHISYKIALYDGKLNSLYSIESLLSLAIFEVSNIIEHNIIIKKCENCGKYFIPAGRSDAIYCDRVSPLDPERTCKEYGSQKLWYDRLKADEVAKLSRNVYMAKQMLVKRNPDIDAYREMFEYYKSKRKEWEQEVKSGIKSREEYISWLNEMKTKKVL